MIQIGNLQHSIGRVGYRDKVKENKTLGGNKDQRVTTFCMAVN